MAVLVTAIHAFAMRQDVDGRNKSGHDAEGSASMSGSGSEAE